MANVKENKTQWDGSYKWKNRGDEWSDAWGGPAMQWYGSILPRIRSHVPTNRIVEIACGYGRWTQYLKDLCNNLIVIDLSDECIQACKQRFSNSVNIDYFVNDGTSLDMISDSTVDFVFSFDSLVHVDQSVINSYFYHLQRILNKDGVAFIHHSNLGEYNNRYLKIRKVPKLEGLLKRLGFMEKNLHWRDSSVDSRKVEVLARENGLRCISQEIITWGTNKILIDCMSTIVKDSSSASRNNRIIRNPYFMKEAQNLSLISSLYG